MPSDLQPSFNVGILVSQRCFHKTNNPRKCRKWTLTYFVGCTILQVMYLKGSWMFECNLWLIALIKSCLTFYGTRHKAKNKHHEHQISLIGCLFYSMLYLVVPCSTVFDMYCRKEVSSVQRVLKILYIQCCLSVECTKGGLAAFDTRQQIDVSIYTVNQKSREATFTSYILFSQIVAC